MIIALTAVFGGGGGNTRCDRRICQLKKTARPTSDVNAFVPRIQSRSTKSESSGLRLNVPHRFRNLESPFRERLGVSRIERIPSGFETAPLIASFLGVSCRH